MDGVRPDSSSTGRPTASTRRRRIARGFGAGSSPYSALPSPGERNKKRWKFWLLFSALTQLPFNLTPHLYSRRRPRVHSQHPCFLPTRPHSINKLAFRNCGQLSTFWTAQIIHASFLNRRCLGGAAEP